MHRKSEGEVVRQLDFNCRNLKDLPIYIIYFQSTFTFIYNTYDYHIYNRWYLVCIYSVSITQFLVWFRKALHQLRAVQLTFLRCWIGQDSVECCEGQRQSAGHAPGAVGKLWHLCLSFCNTRDVQELWWFHVICIGQCMIISDHLCLCFGRCW